METILDKEEQAMAINLAMSIENGVINLNTVLENINSDPIGWSHILAFWMRCDEMTQRVVNRLVLEKNYSLSVSTKLD